MIRRAVSVDARALAELGARTFSQAFGADNRAEDLAVHLEEFYGEAQQRREIDDPGFVTLLAVDGERLIGFCLLYTSSRRPPPSEPAACRTWPGPARD